MTVISKSDFDNWKSDPVTKAFFQAAQERVEEAKDVLSNVEDKIILMIKNSKEFKKLVKDTLKNSL